MKPIKTGRALIGAVLAASLLAGATTPGAAQAHVLIKDEGAWVWVRYTIRGRQGPLLRVRRDSVDAKRALWFAAQATKRERQHKVRKFSGVKGPR
ncbi:MAG: hypothetical protein M3347_04280 [Armatimonadota bacterium]|nr:hypothetical protein [Armatimonadota bacterium]